MWGELSRLLASLNAERDIRVVVITGAGEEAFSAGADIQDFEQYRSDSAKGRLYNEAVNELLGTLAEMAKPSLLDLTPAEADLPLTQFDTRDYQEGYRAFLEKRKPRFVGE